MDLKKKYSRNKKYDNHNAKESAKKFLTFLSASVSVGKLIRIWETCKVKSDPARVAEFLIVQTTSSPFSSDTCNNNICTKNCLEHRYNSEEVKQKTAKSNFSKLTNPASQLKQQSDIVIRDAAF